MLTPIKHKGINWIGGMDISEDQMIDMDNYYIDSFRDIVALQLTDYNYGLLPPYKGESLSSDFDITNHITNHVEVILRRCNAITAAGCRIDINPVDSSEYLTMEHSFEDAAGSEGAAQWDVILVVKPFSRIPVGEPNPEETPPRRPYVSKEYELKIMPSGGSRFDHAAVNHIIIGKVIKDNDQYVVDSSYIPPCTSINSNPELIEYHRQFGKCFNIIELSAQKIIQKVQEHPKPSDIAKNVNFLCEKLLTHIGIVYFDYRNKNMYLPPIDTIGCCSSLAHICYSSLTFIRKKEREELLKYFYEWSDVTPGNFDILLSSMLEMTYNHGNIRAIMEKTKYFMTVLSGLWIKLSALEYIGQHKENIVVAEQSEQQDIPQKKGWSLVD